MLCRASRPGLVIGIAQDAGRADMRHLAGRLVGGSDDANDDTWPVATLTTTLRLGLTPPAARPCASRGTAL
ncbi:MAG: hypothetical protein E6Q40_10195 [Cupriavidus sp.]|nr:MAG: hypothetical protein E6Q40_10195 [Cupriavidus sp.]